MQISIKEIASILLQNDNYIIINHNKPDGDAVGSAAALCLGLRALGKRASVWKNPETTPKFMPWIAGLETEEVPAGAYLITVDTAAENMFPKNGDAFLGQVALAIDHHPSNSGYAGLFHVNAGAAACGEIILDLLLELLGPGQISREMADALYLALCTDTGCFQYSNVTPKTLRSAALLKELGAEAYQTNKIMYGTRSIARLRLEAALTESAEFYAGGIVCVTTITREMRQRLNASEDDVGALSGFPRDIEGVLVGVMIKEQPDGSAKVSLRTETGYNASEICSTLGGGGHAAAAGVTLMVSPAEAKEKILAAIADYGVVL